MTKIIISPGYGCGWSTHIDSKEAAEYSLTYAPLVDYLWDMQQSKEICSDAEHSRYHKELNNIFHTFKEEVDKRFLGVSLPYDAVDCFVTMVQPDRPFLIMEYDGCEWVEYLDNLRVMSMPGDVNEG